MIFLRKIEDTLLFNDCSFILIVTFSFSTFLHKIEIPFKFNKPTFFNYNEYLDDFNMMLIERINKEIKNVIFNNNEYEIDTLMDNFENLKISDSLSMNNKNNQCDFKSCCSFISIDKFSDEYIKFIRDIINIIKMTGILYYNNYFSVFNNNNMYRIDSEQINKETGKNGLI